MFWCSATVPFNLNFLEWEKRDEEVGLFCLEALLITVYISQCIPQTAVFLYCHDWRWFHSQWDWHITNRKGQRSQRVATLKEARCWRHTHIMRAGRRIFDFPQAMNVNVSSRVFSFFPQFAMITWPWSYRLALRFLDVSNKSYSEAMKFKCRTSPPPFTTLNSHTPPTMHLVGGCWLNSKDMCFPLLHRNTSPTPFQKLVFKIKSL